MKKDSLGLLVRLEAQIGKESALENFLGGGLKLVLDEPETVKWFAIRLGPTTFGIFDTFSTEEGRQAHLDGKLAAALMANVSELLSENPTIEKFDIFSAKI